MKEAILNLEKGRAIDIKIGLITYDIYNIDNIFFEVSQTSHGWTSVQISKDILMKCLDEMSFYSIF